MSKEEKELPRFTRDFVTEGDDVCISMDAEMFKDMFALMSALVLDEVQVSIKSEGLEIFQVEEAGVALTDMFVPKQYFNVLKAGQKIKELRLPIRDVNIVLRSLGHGDIVEFTVTPEGKLHVEIKGRRTRAFNLPNYEPDKIKRRYPKVPFQVRIKTTMEGILIAIEDANSLLSRGVKRKERYLYAHALMTTTPMGLHIKSATDDGLYGTETTLTAGWDIMQFQGSVGVEVMIGIPYLIKVVKAISKVSNIIQLEFATNMPLHIIAEMPFKGTKLEYWFAPRVPVEPETKEVKEE